MKLVGWNKFPFLNQIHMMCHKRARFCSVPLCLRGIPPPKQHFKVIRYQVPSDHGQSMFRASCMSFTIVCSVSISLCQSILSETHPPDSDTRHLLWKHCRAPIWIRVTWASSTFASSPNEWSIPFPPIPLKDVLSVSRMNFTTDNENSEHDLRKSWKSHHKFWISNDLYELKAHYG